MPIRRNRLLSLARRHARFTAIYQYQLPRQNDYVKLNFYWFCVAYLMTDDVRVTANIISSKLSARVAYQRDYKFVRPSKCCTILSIVALKKGSLMSSLLGRSASPQPNIVWRDLALIVAGKRGLAKQPLSALHALYDSVGHCAIVVALLNANKYQSLMNCQAGFFRIKWILLYTECWHFVAFATIAISLVRSSSGTIFTTSIPLNCCSIFGVPSFVDSRRLNSANDFNGIFSPLVSVNKTTKKKFKILYFRQKNIE